MSTNTNLETVDISVEYFQWLTHTVGVRDRKGHTYHHLLKKLHDIPFQCLVDYDDNRIIDSLRLRRTFCMEYDVEDLYSFLVNHLEYDQVSMLELLINLAIDMDNNLIEPGGTPMVYAYFWELIENAGLIAFNDQRFFEIGGYFEVSRIVLNIIMRDYGRNGEGGLFPLRESEKDQRTVELWYQMHAYLNEKWYD